MSSDECHVAARANASCRSITPGEAKLQLKERLSRSKALSERLVGIETTDKLTDPQIVAKVKEHYGIDP